MVTVLVPSVCIVTTIMQALSDVPSLPSLLHFLYLYTERKYGGIGRCPLKLVSLSLNSPFEAAAGHSSCGLQQSTVVTTHVVPLRSSPPTRIRGRHRTHVPHAQVYVRGEFVGGADILHGMHQSGELEKVLEPIRKEQGGRI